MTNNIKSKFIVDMVLTLITVIVIVYFGYSIRDEITIWTLLESLRMICFYFILLLPVIFTSLYKKITCRGRMYSENVSLGIFLITFAMILFVLVF